MTKPQVSAFCFLYDDYALIIEKLRRNSFSIIQYEAAGSHEKEAILRHDVDVSLQKALAFAEFEREIGVRSTYYILLCSRFYNVFDRESREYIKEIYASGHSIGLHFDETNYSIKSKDDSKKLILKERAQLENALDSIPVNSVSMHIPSRMMLDADLSFEDGLINSYGHKYFKGYKYASDSEMRWRENIHQLIESNQYNKLHILTHPIWYDTAPLTKEEKLLNCLKSYKKEQLEAMKAIVPGLKLKIEDY